MMNKMQSIQEEFAVTSIAFNPAGNLLATSNISADIAHIWQLGQPPKKVATLNLKDNLNEVNSLSWGRGYLAAIANVTKEILIFDDSFILVKTLEKGISRGFMANHFNGQDNRLLVATKRPLNQTMQKLGLAQFNDLVIYDSQTWQAQEFDSQFTLGAVAWLNDSIVMAGNDHQKGHAFSVAVLDPASGQKHTLELATASYEVNLAVLDDSGLIALSYTIDNDKYGTFTTYFYLLAYDATGAFKVLHSHVIPYPTKLLSLVFSQGKILLNQLQDGQGKLTVLDLTGQVQEVITLPKPSVYGLTSSSTQAAIGAGEQVILLDL